MEMNLPLLELGKSLKNRQYSFVTITPASHERVLTRKNFFPSDPLRAVFGWSQPFEKAQLDQAGAHFFTLLERAEALESLPGGGFKSRVRFSTLGSCLFLHSAHPTKEADSVFFGPDTYRFTCFVKAQVEDLLKAEDSRFRLTRPLKRALDLGCGAGTGGLDLLHHFAEDLSEVILTDINPLALQYTGINAALNLSEATLAKASFQESDLYANVSGGFDLILANPPFLIDREKRSYRHGGEDTGAEVSLEIVKGALPRLKPGGKLILYTASAIQDGRDQLINSVHKILLAPFKKHELTYVELDPDIFGEELSRQPYSEIDRLAAVGLVVTRPRTSE